VVKKAAERLVKGVGQAMLAMLAVLAVLAMQAVQLLLIERRWLDRVLVRRKGSTGTLYYKALAGSRVGAPGPAPIRLDLLVKGHG